jgi:hypothetical protein
MAPISHTVFAVSLFFALVALWLWAKRRRRAADSARRTADGIRALLGD